MRQHGLSAGWRWFQCGWRLFAANPAGWAALGVGYLAITLLLSMVPLLGPLLSVLLTPALLAGVSVAGEEASRGRPVGLLALGAGLRDPRRRGPLLRLGALMLLAYIIAVVVASLFVVALAVALGISLLAGEPTGGMVTPEMLTPEGLVFVVITAVLTTAVVAAAFFFAVPLVMLRGLAPASAIAASLAACRANLAPLLVFLAGYLASAVLAAATLLLGLVVVAPIILATWCCSYRAIFAPAGEDATLAA